MFRLSTNKINYREVLGEFSQALQVKLLGNRLVFPPHIADGFLQVEELANGLLVMISDFSMNSNLDFERNNTEEEFYFLRFEHTMSGNYLVTKIEGEEFREQHMERARVFLTCSLMDVGFAIGRGTDTQAIAVQFSREWLAKFLKMETYDKILQHYLALKTKALLFEPLDAEYRRILKEIRELDISHPTHSTILHNRIMMLIERFFFNLYEKRKRLRYRVDLSDEDIQKVRKVERMITEDLKKDCTPINELARMVFISPSKLKNIFRKMFGVPIYQHYLQQKMHEARRMLLSGKYTVKEVGMGLGYNNLSNFSSAFKKEFGILPSNLLREQKTGLTS
jgi:AraC-like DNA-binding protein